MKQEWKGYFGTGVAWYFKHFHGIVLWLFFLKENFSNSKICVVHISVLHRYFFTDVKKYRYLMTGSSLAKIGLWKQKQDSKNCFCWRSPIKNMM